MAEPFRFSEVMAIGWQYSAYLLRRTARTVRDAFKRGAPRNMGPTL